MGFCVGIDVGHGGHNYGATWPAWKGRIPRRTDSGWGDYESFVLGCPIIERDMNLVLATILGGELSDMGIPYKMTRDWQEEVTFTQRGRMLRDCNPIISIHCNAIHDPGVRGAEVYYLANDAHALPWAQAIAKAMPEPLQTTRLRAAWNDPKTDKDNWMEAPIRVLTPHRGRAPVLVECGYLTNDHDREYITTEPGRTEIAKAIARAVRSQLKGVL